MAANRERRHGLQRRELLRMSALAAGSLLTSESLAIPPLSAAQHKKLPIGMNLAGLADWETGYPFLNLMWGARAWLTHAVNLQGPWDSQMTQFLELDSDGYPLEVPIRPPSSATAHHVFTVLPNAVAAGNYVILYDGEGHISVTGGSRIIQSQPGRIVISMQHAEERIEVLTIHKSMRGNHVRNIRVLPIRHERADLAKNPFRPELLEFCKPWHCLRFTDWLGTNDNVNRRWSDRKRRSFYTQIGAHGDALGLFGEPMPAWRKRWPSGAATELCIELANLTKTDAWFSVPHLADDEYIAEMAKLVKARLDPALKVYVEFSNEIWNWQFQQAQWMLRSELAGDLVTAAGHSPPWKGQRKPARFRDGVVEKGAGEGTDHPERIGALFRRCFKLWENEFSGAARSRLVRVCAVHAHWADTASRTLSWVMKHGGCDAFSPAAYFGPNDEVYKRWDAAGANLTADDVIKDMRSMIESERKVSGQMAGIARKAGVRLVIYEGGQHIQSRGQASAPYNPALGAAQKHPAMYDLYRQMIDIQSDAGCDLFCAFSSVGRQGTRWGSWGHAERYGQDPSEMPKYRAILEANVDRRR